MAVSATPSTPPFHVQISMLQVWKQHRFDLARKWDCHDAHLDDRRLASFKGETEECA